MFIAERRNGWIYMIKKIRGILWIAVCIGLGIGSYKFFSVAVVLLGIIFAVLAVGALICGIYQLKK